MPRIRRAVVSGVTGFIGSALASRLIAEGGEVVGLTRGTSRRDRIAHLRGLRLVEWDGRDVASLQSTLAEFRPETVFHTAAYGVQPGEKDAQSLVDGNVAYAVNLLTAVASLANCRFIHTGSCSEYGPVESTQPLTEEAPTRPTTAYGASKLAATLLAHTLGVQWNVPTVTLRLFMTYGPGEGALRLLPCLVESLTAGRPLDLTPGEQVRDWLYVEDAVEAYLCAATTAADRVAGNVYNICTGIGTTVREVGDATARLLDAPSECLHWGARAYRPFEPMYLVGDSQRFQAATAWRPAFSVTAGLAALTAPFARGLCA